MWSILVGRSLRYRAGPSFVFNSRSMTRAKVWHEKIEFFELVGAVNWGKV